MMVVLDMGFWNFRESSILKGMRYYNTRRSIAHSNYTKEDLQFLCDISEKNRNRTSHMDMPFYFLGIVIYGLLYIPFGDSKLCKLGEDLRDFKARDEFY